MKSILVILSLVASSVASASQCDQSKLGKWIFVDHVAKTWNCEIKAEVGGASIGLVKSLQLMAGRGTFTCEARGVDRTLVGCYKENVRFGLVGGGVGLGLSIVESMKVRSVGLNLLDIEPEYFVSLARLGVGANASLQLADVTKGAAATMSFSLANGINFGLSLFDGRGLGLYAGAHVTGFVMGDENYDGVVVDAGRQIDDFFNRLFVQLRSKNTNVDSTVFSRKNILNSAAEATAIANEKYPNNFKPGIRVYSSDNELADTSMNSFIERGLVKSSNACQGNLLKVYAVLNCKSQDCSEAYFKAVCK